MLTFLFWNLGSARATLGEIDSERWNRLKTSLGRLTRLYRVDLLILAESPIPPDDLLRELNQPHSNAGGSKFRAPNPQSTCKRISIFPRFSNKFLGLAHESAYYSGRIIRLPNPQPEILLFAVHFRSKLFKSESSQMLSLPGFSDIIRKRENERNHRRTIIVGDFNMNPFEAGVVGAEGLNAVMARTIARKRSRIVEKVSYPFFYNPMWSHFGDSSHEARPPGTPDHEPPGTCYYPARESRWYYWNMFDQVLLRPALLPWFKNQDLKILVGDGTISFIDNDGIPDRDNVSDHLPLLFSLDIGGDFNG